MPTHATSQRRSSGGRPRKVMTAKPRSFFGWKVRQRLASN
jgi:hypothetical protein